MKRSKKAIYNICSNFLLQFIVIIYGFIVPKIIISCYGSETNGLISSITQFLSYIALLDSGFTAVVKSQLYKPIADKNKNKVASILKSADRFFKNIAFIFIVYIVVLAFIYPLIVKNAFNYLYTFSLIIIISISTFSEYYFGMVYRMFLQADQKSYIISLIQIFTYIITIFITIILAKLNMSIQLLKLFTAFAFVLRPLLQNIYVKKSYKIDLKNADKSYKIKNKWDGLAQHIASVIHNNTDITLLTFFSNLIEVSVYSVYYLVIKGIKSIIQSFTHGIDALYGDMLAKNESTKLNATFNTFEVVFNNLSTIIFCSAMVLIVPFVTIYTKNITDANYIRLEFGYLIVVSEFIWAIRQPYNELIKAAGHFRETMIGSWIECFSNIIISIILVNKYGIIGVVIGTIVAMTIRTIELIYHSNKYILKRSNTISIKNIFIILICSITIFIICNIIPLREYTDYVILIINAFIVFIMACIIVLIGDLIFYRKELKELHKFIKRIIKKEHDM